LTHFVIWHYPPCCAISPLSLQTSIGLGWQWFIHPLFLPFGDGSILILRRSGVKGILKYKTLTGPDVFSHNGGGSCLKKDPMPLEFQSLSHGRIAFGFFNIETDIVLLNQYFLFGEDFCRYVVQASENRHPLYETAWEVYQIERENIGNLMGAIHGLDHRGFIGEVYKLFPFPKRREDFKQKPEGFKTRTLIENLIREYASTADIRFSMDSKSGRITIAEYLFDKFSFHALIKYVWMGGLPRWKEDRRPDYVLAMKAAIEQSPHPLFERILFS
jgi:hypothetical protein